MDRYVKIVNTSTEVISYPWVVALLNPQELVGLEQYKQTAEYLGFDEVDKQAKKKIPEALRVRGYMNNLERGVFFEEVYKDRSGASRVEKVLKWVLGPNYEAIKKNPRGIYTARDLCQRYKIPFSTNETVAELIEKLKAKFGSYETVLTVSQYEESGLKRAFGKREILQSHSKSNPQSIVWEGLLEASEIAPNEAEELMGGKLADIDTLSVDIYKLPYPTLLAMAKEKGIPNYTQKKKVELIELLS